MSFLIFLTYTKSKKVSIIRGKAAGNSQLLKRKYLTRRRGDAGGEERELKAFGTAVAIFHSSHSFLRPNEA
jgi:hypothetical protein